MAASSTSVFVGYGGFLGFGIETTYDTGVTPSKFIPIISGSIREEYPQVPRPTLHFGTGRVATGYVVQSHDVTVTLEVELAYDTIGLLYRAITGPAPTTTGAGPYTHPFILGNELPSLTLRIYRGKATGALTARYDEATGCICNSATIIKRAGESPRLRMEFFGKSVSRDDQSAETMTIPTPVLYHQVGTLAWNSASYDGNSLELSINNGLARRRNLGSLKTMQTHPSSLRDIRLKLQRDHVDSDFIAALSAQTESAFSYTFTSGSNTLTFALHSARVAGPADVGLSEGGFGAIPETVELVPRWDTGGTNYGLAITMVNANASYAT